MRILRLTQITEAKEYEGGFVMDPKLDKYLSKAEVLIEALPYIQKFNRKVIVVKYGGSAMLHF